MISRQIYRMVVARRCETEVEFEQHNARVVVFHVSTLCENGVNVLFRRSTPETPVICFWEFCEYLDHIFSSQKETILKVQVPRALKYKGLE